MRGNLYVISAPAGAGKTTITNMLLNELDFLQRVVTVTTRQKRVNEIDGVDYIFKTEEEFKQMIENGELLEYAVVHGNYYGTPRKQVEEYLSQGYDVVLVIDVQGMRQVKANFPEVITIFILPPSLKELIARMKVRGDDEREIEKRIKTATSELPAWKEYDYIVINDNLERATNSIKCIIVSNRLKRDKFDVRIIEDEEIRKYLV
ncbi:MAG: guanylate kinase [Hydrogenothermaceae bacterium]|nr:guanylate kinase [Hydrogenothermaceae bacterium]